MKEHQEEEDHNLVSLYCIAAKEKYILEPQLLK